jgi:hypothetical protein
MFPRSPCADRLQAAPSALGWPGWKRALRRAWLRPEVRLGLLLALCIVPRALLAWNMTSACDDAYYYIHAADCLDRGEFPRALDYLNVNVYPVVLVGLHRLGLDWIVAGKLWGLAISSLLVLPLYDWIGRMFNERSAAIACFLYAVHPRIIEFSVEPIRDATFWFLFVLGLDLLWRMTRERRAWQFAAWGTVFALAVHTRLEGWLLCVPLAVWSATRWHGEPAARRRLALGCAASLAITPLFVAAYNVTVLAGHQRWEPGRLAPFAALAGRIQTKIVPLLPAHSRWSSAAGLATSEAGNTTTGLQSAVLVPAPAGGSRDAPSPQLRAPVGGPMDRLRTYITEMSAALGPPFLALILMGLVVSGRRLCKPEHAVLPLLTALVLVAVWIQLADAGRMDGRYFLILLLIDGAPAASACLKARRWLDRRFGKAAADGPAGELRSATIAAIAALVVSAADCSGRLTV